MMRDVRWDTDADVYRSLETGFDELAPSYEEDVGGNLIGVEMREVFREALLGAFERPSFLFEIGCGTGADALWLARRGHEIVATDISEAMLDRVRERAKAEGLTERIRCRKLAARDIGDLRGAFGEAAFDGGYCHAGALNMEPELDRVPSSLARIVKPGGGFVCSIINKTSLFELLVYPGILRPRKAFRRMGRMVPLPISRKPPLNRFVVPARFYSPSETARMFRGPFSLVSVRGVRILLPPANLTDEYARVHDAFVPLARLEAHVATLPLLRSCGHHSILTFRRT